MSSTEPVYQHSNQPQQQIDTKPINEILGQYLSGDITDSKSILKMISLRHKLLAHVRKKPANLEELYKLQIEANKEISDSIWGPKDQEQLLNFCNKHWKTKLFDDSAKETIQATKAEIGSLLPVMDKAEIGFLMLRCLKAKTPAEDFIFEKVLPLLKAIEIPGDQSGKICAIILKNYQRLEEDYFG